MMGTAVYSIRLVVRTYIIQTRHNRFCWFVFNSSNVFHRYLEKIRQTADIQARLGTIIRWVRNVEENALHALQLRTRLIYFRIIFRQLRFITHYSSLSSGFSSRTRSRFVGFILMSEAPCVCTRSRPEKTCAEDFVCTHCIETSYVITLPPPLCSQSFSVRHWHGWNRSLLTHDDLWCSNRPNRLAAYKYIITYRPEWKHRNFHWATTLKKKISSSNNMNIKIDIIIS